ncbi:SAC3/GANP/Nin1/mts3/eIF-3 p25 family-domain-containing protein [Multifurca ochricompacta]|uniref:SAC3/GANP/Nin1/mts3/eIF-3 p25 family-domain-containing protein n=1 Tax=Multifurca ochricompacta TaxID=376703 RepID=A0AAD4LXM3_9AGAM|nr:SAC3/GANP/Nin1/mts3/eIF-3 p25 family-domain-containing protein [Multifurca ochricompacta]
MYERAAGDKTLPSDLRPPPVLKRTLDYLFRELLHKEGFSPTFDFIRDRSRAVRSDFTMQHETGQLAIECHERCARFHILALHFERDRTGFSVALEEQQLMNTLQSLKEFYEDQRGRCELPNELEMRIYHRLIHIRDQRERHDDIPDTILTHPVFLLTTKFRQHVQAKSSPITKFSPLIVTEEGMLQFAELAALLREQGNRVMVYLVACILERLFGKDTIEEIEAIRDGIVVPDIIDGVLSVEELDDAVADADAELIDYDEEEAFLREDEPVVEEPEEPDEPQHQHQSKPLKPSATEWLTNNFGVRPSPSVMLDGLGSGSSTSAFTSAFGSNIPAPPTSMAPSSVPPATSAFANLKTSLNVFGNRNFGSNSVFGVSSSTPGVVNEAGVQGQTVRDSTTKPSASLSPFVASTSTSAFGSPFARSAAFASTSQIPNAAGVVASSPFTFSTSQSAPSGFPAGRRLPDTGLGVDTTPPTSTGPGFSEKHGQSSSPSVTGLNAKASAFTPGQQFGVPLSTSTVPVNDEKKEKSTTGFFNASSSSPTSATASTRPILPPINTSPLSSTSTSNPVTTHLATSQSAPSLNGSTKRPSLPNNLEPQPTLVDGFETLEENHSPQHPPPLKVQPISLPGTPTATSASTSFSFPPKQKSTNNLFGWPSAQSTSAPEILSPLVLSSRNSFASLPSPSVSARPSLSRFPSLAESPTPTGQSGPSQDTASELPSSKEPPKHRKSPPSPQDVEMTSPISAPLRNGKGKGKGKAKTPVVDVDDLEAKASSFARTSAPVRDAFKRWADKASERILYNNAVRRSDAYTGRKTKKRQDPRSRANTASDHESEAKASARRTRRRVSAKYTAPQTDAELARRLKENHEQHERRWAPGTFLAALRAHVGNPVPFDYSLWLSLNPENDGTAIWVEKKFDVPNSGAWVSERVFSIPLAPGVESRSPGLVAFECSPLDGVDDEIEKKFRILDDCARLREVIETFPEDRHFISSVLFILWGENDVVALSDDLRLMTDDYEAKGVIGSHATFSLSSKTKDWTRSSRKC